MDRPSLIWWHGRLAGGFQAVRRCLECLQVNHNYGTTTIGEPQLGKHGLYPTVSTLENWKQFKGINDLVGYCDEKQDGNT